MESTESTKWVRVVVRERKAWRALPFWVQLSDEALIGPLCFLFVFVFFFFWVVVVVMAGSTLLLSHYYFLFIIIIVFLFLFCFVENLLGYLVMGEWCSCLFSLFSKERQKR